LNAFSEKYQAAKALMSNIATENLQNIRTVKAFADEDMCSTKFQLASQDVFEYGRTRGYLWALFFISFKFLGSGGDVLILYIVTLNFVNFGLTIGAVTTLLMYCRTIIMNAGALTNNI